MTEILSSADGRTVLVMRRELRHPAERVWRALTEPGELRGWFPAAVELDLRLDGVVTFTFEEDPGAPVDEQSSGVIRAYEPLKLIEYTWGAEVLRWELTPTATGCILQLTATYDDRPGSASFAGGWTLCFDALERVLGDRVPQQDYRVLHEHFVKVFGLDEGAVGPDGEVRFERQLTMPKDEVWRRLGGTVSVSVSVGDRPPAGFVAKGIEPGAVTAADEPTRLSFRWAGGEVRWTLRDGNGGARVTLTQTGAAAQYLAAWRDLIEELAG
jgi:uncharacterized protein YndB with AHSA1/START domain